MERRCLKKAKKVNFLEKTGDCRVKAARYVAWTERRPAIAAIGCAPHNQRS
jgi:hypothetical protein